MTRPRASTVLRRFLDGESFEQLADMCGREGDHDDYSALTYVEHCIRRGLRGEVRIPVASRRRS